MLFMHSTLRGTARRFVFFAVSAVSILLMATCTQAAAPQVKTQAPGYYRMMLGSYEITAVSDGTVTIPLDELLTNTTPDEVETLLARAFLTPDVETSINTFLINTGSALVLVDAGAGSLFGPTAGGLIQNLKAAGYQPEDIDAVLLTHIHGDHSYGLTANGKPVFPNAIVYMHQREADFWLDPSNAETVAERHRHAFGEAEVALAPYRAADRIKLLSDGDEAFPGIHCVATPGHTPGHCAYSVESQDRRLLIWGDLVHAQDVQFPKPSITIRFDIDSSAAARQRKLALHEAALHGYWVAAAHISFPGIGHVRAEEDGYVWVPANYSATP